MEQQTSPATMPMMNIYFVKAGIKKAKTKTETFTQTFHIVNLTKKKIWKITKNKSQE